MPVDGRYQTCQPAGTENPEILRKGVPKTSKTLKKLNLEIHIIINQRVPMAYLCINN